MPSDPPAAAGAPHVVGLLLAAGAGTRMGRPKALVTDPTTGEPWLARGIRTLLAGGCSTVIVVLGAAHAEARALLAPRPDAAGGEVHVVVAEQWAEGLGASLRAGLTAADGVDAEVVVVSLVDLPELSAGAVARILNPPLVATSLRQATYGGRPGHPVLIAAAHLGPLAAALEGDRGARPYLRAYGATEIDCTDLGGGDDVDTLSPTAD